MPNALRPILSRFAQSDRGSVTVEFVLIMPMLFWAFMASYVFFDGFRQSALNLKAAYTIGDLISRETAAVNDTYIDSMYRLFQLMTRANSPTSMRISVVRYDANRDRYYVDWSEIRGGYQYARDDNNVQDIRERLPEMPNGERVILVETSNTYEPVFNIGFGNIDLDNFVFTRPRFAPQVAWSDS